MDLQRLLHLCQEGGQELQGVLAESHSQPLDELLHSWLAGAKPAHGPILLAWAGAALLSQNLCPGMLTSPLKQCQAALIST